MSYNKNKKDDYIKPMSRVFLINNESLLAGTVVGDHKPATDDEPLESKRYDFFYENEDEY